MEYLRLDNLLTKKKRELFSSQFWKLSIKWAVPSRDFSNVDGVTVVAAEVRDHVVRQEGGKGWGGRARLGGWAGLGRRARLGVMGRAWGGAGRAGAVVQTHIFTAHSGKNQCRS